MSQQLEIEFKNLLTKEEFLQFLQVFQVQEEDFALQHNHYLDTKSFHLEEQACALRVREKEGTFELTLKQPAEIGLLETNQLLLKEEAEALLMKGEFPEGIVKEVLQPLLLDFDSFHHFGTLSTKRAEIPYEVGILTFDNSFYLGKEDYELEYEVTEEQKGKEIFDHLLKKFQIPRRMTDNKVRRFFLEKLRQLNEK
ncbi:CYTH domain-containing protein [Bacillus sp. FJAT-42315]|uniref:CYTH domain-containing protein n=1 Tax=Bacillus sp. FJAT-42315 TaxID=2014077 RepID=UPI000C2302CA|nr:CYTH domain-containing protein [Bacillus sp. FJAT-42315]